MADERMSDGEIRRNFDRQDRLIADLAKSTVPIDAWNRENVYRQEQRTEDAQDCKDRATANDIKIDKVEKAAMTAIGRLEKRKERTVGRLLTIVGILVTLLGTVWAIAASVKGIH